MSRYVELQMEVTVDIFWFWRRTEVVASRLDLEAIDILHKDPFSYNCIALLKTGHKVKIHTDYVLVARLLDDHNKEIS